MAAGLRLWTGCLVLVARPFSNGLVPADDLKDADLRWGMPLGRVEGRFDLFLERDLAMMVLDDK